MSNRDSGWLEYLADFSFRAVLFHPAALMVLLMSAMVLISIAMWNRFHQQIDLASNKRLDNSMIEVSPQPAWVPTDVKQLATRESGLDELNLLQPDLAQRVADAFAVQSWIESVNQVCKKPSGVTVDVTFRRPVALVEVERDQLIPVDAKSVVLDGRGFTPQDTALYLRISVPQAFWQTISTGRTWKDLRIADAASIAEVWGERWRLAGLFRIVNRTNPTNDPIRLHSFELWTRLRPATKIIWGSAPGKEAEGEAAAEEKIEAILSFVTRNGPLTQSEHEFLDVTTGKVVPREASDLAKQDVGFVRF